MINKVQNYTLLELLLTISILGIVSSIALAQFSTTEQEARDIVRNAEMSKIQKAFINFYNDVSPTDTNLISIGDYGLWCLTQKEHPMATKTTAWETSYDTYKGKGWRGPYAHTEKIIRIVKPTKNINRTGQIVGDYCDVPVLLTPLGQHYRVVIPRYGSTRYYRNITLIDPGQNDVIDSTVIFTDLSQEQIVAKGDDTVLQLLPGDHYL